MGLFIHKIAPARRGAKACCGWVKAGGIPTCVRMTALKGTLGALPPAGCIRAQSQIRHGLVTANIMMVNKPE